jgi:hypothetical protein
VSEEGSGFQARSSRAERAIRYCASSSQSAASVGNRAPAVLKTKGGPQRARIARRWPGRTNKQTRFSSASERGRQRLPSAILASGASNQKPREQLSVSCERRESRARRAEEERAEALFPLRATTKSADPSARCASSSQNCAAVYKRLRVALFGPIRAPIQELCVTNLPD